MHPKSCLSCVNAIIDTHNFGVKGCKVNAPQIFVEYEYMNEEYPCPQYERDYDENDLN
jgi:hypothetical protein